MPQLFHFLPIVKNSTHRRFIVILYCINTAIIIKILSTQITDSHYEICLRAIKCTSKKKKIRHLYCKQVAKKKILLNFAEYVHFFNVIYLLTKIWFRLHQSNYVIGIMFKWMRRMAHLQFLFRSPLPCSLKKIHDLRIFFGCFWW